MSRRGLLRLCAALLLLAGLAGGAALYAFAMNAPPDAAGYVVGEDGAAYPVSALDSRRTRRELELYGGKSAIWMTELTEWFAGLAHGKGLAVSVAVAGAIGSACCLLFAEAEDEDGGDDEA